MKLRMTDELRGVLELLAESRQGGDAPAASAAGGRVHGDLDLVVDGAVQLVVEPLGDFDGIAAIERVLATLPQVRDVHVRTADGMRAVYELDLRAPGPLFRSLDGELPFDVDALAVDGVLVLRVREAQ